MGRLIGTDESVPVAASYPSHPITRELQPADGLSAGAIDDADRRRRQRPHGAAARRDEPQQLGGDRPQEPDRRPAGEDGRRRQEGAGVARRRGRRRRRRRAPTSRIRRPATIADKKPETRVVAFGDSDFASNAALGVQGNRDLFLNTVNWLAQQENLISIRPNDADDRRITLTADQERRIFFLTVLIVPGLILLAGVQTWWRRR